MMTQLKTLWRERTDRERWILIIATVAIGYALIDQLWLTPTLAKREALQVSITEKTEQLAWLQKTVANKQLLGGSGASVPANGAMVFTINKFSDQFELREFLVDNKSPTSNSARVQFKQAPFNRILNWLQAMANQGIQVKQSAIKMGSQPGVVDVRLTLERG